jgi:hypothetical protein
MFHILSFVSFSPQSAFFLRRVSSFLYFYNKKFLLSCQESSVETPLLKKVVLASIILVFLMVGKLDSPSANPSPGPKE